MECMNEAVVIEGNSLMEPRHNNQTIIEEDEDEEEVREFGADGEEREENKRYPTLNEIIGLDWKQI